jgi:hypothetical protein
MEHQRPQHSYREISIPTPPPLIKEEKVKPIPLLNELVQKHYVLYRNHPVVVDEVEIIFHPIEKQHATILLSPGTLPASQELIALIESEICKGVQEPWSYNVMHFPVAYHILQWERIDIMKSRAALVASGEVASCLVAP